MKKKNLSAAVLAVSMLFTSGIPAFAQETSAISPIMMKTSTDTADAENAVEDFMDAVMSGDLDTVSDLLSSNPDLDGELMDCLEVASLGTSMAEEFTSDSSLSNKAKKSVQENLEKNNIKMMQSMIHSWKITDSSVLSKKAEVTLTMTHADFDQMDDIMNDSDFNAAIEEYVNHWGENHQEEVVDYAQSHTEEEFNVWMFNSIMTDIYDQLDEILEEMDVKESKIQVSLVKENGKWKVSSMETLSANTKQYS